MTDLRIFSTAPLRGEGLERLRELGEVVVDPWIDHEPLRLYNSGQLAERVRDEGANVVICEADSCKGPLFELPLVAIGSTRGDPTNVDLDGATAAGIPVLRAPGRNADGVAELAVALALAATRGVVAADRDVREGQVYRDGSIPYQRFRGWQLAGRTVGIVGYGAVGRAAAWRFEGLGMRVISADPFAPDATHSLDDLLAEADLVSMHAAVTPDTVGMISAERISAMQPGAVYVNTARAALHDLDALTAALAAGHLAAAGLDHFEGENLPVDHPLAGMPNVVLTPHIGGATYDTEANHSLLMASGLAALVAGEVPSNLANPEVLHRG
jgi:D-3-phosphoglycerate dehydrogenase